MPMWRPKSKSPNFSVAVAVVAWSMTCGAQSLQDPIAAQLKQVGDTAIEAGRFDEALRAYSQALAIEPTPALHYNRGRALQALGRSAEALEEFEQFDASAPVELKAVVSEFAQMLALVRSQVAEVDIQCSVAGATLSVSERVFELPLRKPLRFAPGSLELRVSANGREPWSVAITLHGGEKRVLVPELKPLDTRGTLTVASPVVGAIVYLDGKAMGAVPLEAKTSPGEHSLALRHPDYQSADTRIVLRARERRSVTLDLSRTPRIYERWWFWTGVGTAIAAGVVTGIAVTTERSPARGDIPPGQIRAALTAW